MKNTAKIVPFATSVRHPLDDKRAARIAAVLDRELEQMIAKLEQASTCQQNNPEALSLTEVPAFAAFCAGLETVAQAMIPHFQACFVGLLEKEKIHSDDAAFLYKARCDALIQYLLQVAQVHGLAFEGAPEKIGAFEKGVLASFEAKVRLISQL